MKNSKKFVLLFLIMASTGCAEAAPKQQLLATPQQILLVQPAIAVPQSATPSATLVPTAAGTPTVDYQAKIGQSELDLKHSLASATMAAVTQQVIDTAQAKLDDSQHKTATATVAVGQTAVAQAVATDNRHATQTLEAPLIEREKVRTQWEPVFQGTICGGVAMVALLLCWAIFTITKAKYFALVTQNPVPENSELNVKLDTRDGYGWGSVDWPALPIDQETLGKVARLIVGGFHYTEKQMTGAGKPLIKDSTFDSFGRWMVLNKIAVQMPDRRYAIQHREFFEQVAHV